MDHAANASRGRRRDHVLRAADVRPQMVGAAPVADGQQGCVRDDDVGAGKTLGQSIRLGEIRTPELDAVASERGHLVGVPDDADDPRAAADERAHDVAPEKARRAGERDRRGHVYLQPSELPLGLSAQLGAGGGPANDASAQRPVVASRATVT